MRWLRLVGSLKLQVSFAEEPYKRDYILQKRPIILRSLLIVATPYTARYSRLSSVTLCRPNTDKILRTKFCTSQWLHIQDTHRTRHTPHNTVTHSHSQTHRHIDTQTHRHTETQIHRRTDTQTHTHFGQLSKSRNDYTADCSKISSVTLCRSATDKISEKSVIFSNKWGNSRVNLIQSRRFESVFRP